MTIAFQRFCQGNCGTDITSKGPLAKWCKACSVENTKAYKRAYEKKHQRWKSRNAERASLAVHSRQVTAQYEATPTRRQKLCPVCCGMPSARTVDRLDWWFGAEISVAVIPPYTGEVAPLPVCRGCGDVFAPDPPLPRGVTLRSSAGTAVRAAAMHGLAGEPYGGRPSRAKVAS